MINISKYGFLRIASAAPKLQVGNPIYNSKQIIELIDKAKSENCSIILFPELAISGYSCGDLFYNQGLLNSCEEELYKISLHCKKHSITAIVGIPIKCNGKLFNSAAVLSQLGISAIIPKTYLCNTQEYYEERWFSSEFDRVNDELNIQNIKVPFGTDILFTNEENKIRFGVEICEDLWAVKPPSLDLASAGANVIFNLSASNEYIGKYQYRKDNVRMHSGRCFAAYIYSSCGVWESSSDTIFSGACMIAENGTITAESERFSYDNEFIFKDIDLSAIESDRMRNNSFGASYPDKSFREIEVEITQPEVTELTSKISKTPFIPFEKSKTKQVCSEIIKIQSNALARRLIHIGTDVSVIGISGGLDSTLALLSTVEAYKLTKKDLMKIYAVSMPGFGSTKRTQNNAQKLAELLGVNLMTISIHDAVDQHFKDINHNPDILDITYENSQARERTQILMDLANKYGGIVIGTGDLSELALGWCTYNGDQMSMYGLNSGIPKTLIKYLIEFYADEIYSDDIKKIILDVLDTPISPELLPPDDEGKIIQKTEDGIGPYILNDFFLYYFLRYGFSIEKIKFLANHAFGSDYEQNFIESSLKNFIQRFITQQYKRSAMPEGIKIGTVSLSPRADWRMPGDITFYKTK